MKKVVKIILCVFSFLFIFTAFDRVSAKTLGDLKNELANTKANQAAIEAKRRETQNKIKEYNSQIVSDGQKIKECEEDIQKSREKIDELEAEIIDKQAEIEELLRFLQVTNGENVYLEYIFGASSFTDFIYRAAIVEQLSDYNDNLIDEMYDMIEENKRLQKELEEKIVNLNVEIENFRKKLSSLNLNLEDLNDERQDIADEIKIAEEEIKYYEEVGCKDSDDINVCASMPYSSGFVRPLKSGYISSNFGYRYIFGSTSFHRGIDIGVSEWTPVYAAASGQVYVVSGVAAGSKRCGGNMLYIKHNINGVKYTSVYMHLIGFNVSAGDYVTVNSIVGYSGGGYGTQSWESCSTGAHLHFGIYKGWTTSNSAAIDPRGLVNFPALYSRFYSRW